jgi:hypothetical protein
MISRVFRLVPLVLAALFIGGAFFRGCPVRP